MGARRTAGERRREAESPETGVLEAVVVLLVRALDLEGAAVLVEASPGEGLKPVARGKDSRV